MVLLRLVKPKVLISSLDYAKKFNQLRVRGHHSWSRSVQYSLKVDYPSIS